MAHGIHRHYGHTHTPTPPETLTPPQMTFAEIGTLYNSISNELEGGVTHQNQQLLLNQVSTVQTQLQNLINSGALNNLDGAGNPAESIVHAQNIADQMNFLKTEVGAFGTDTFVPKFINDVIRDVQDIVAADPALTVLAHQNNHSGFQQVSFLLTPPTPFTDSGLQTDTLLKFISDSNSLAARAQALAGTNPNSAEVHQLETDIQKFSTAADSYSTEQGGLFSARFNNEFTLNGVQGTASRELITGLETGNADLVNGAASVLTANANDVRGNMLTQGNTFTPAPNGGIPAFIDTVHDAGVVFNDAMTKLIGGVYSGNQQSIINDLNATTVGLQNAIKDEGITGQALHDINHIISLLGQQTSLVGGIGTASPTQASVVNGQINEIQAQILNVVNHDATLATMAVGADGTVGFVALPPGTTPSHSDVVAAASNGCNNVAATAPVVAAVDPGTNGAYAAQTAHQSSGAGGSGAIASGRGNDASTSPLAAAVDAGAHGPQTMDHASLHHFEHFWG